MLVGPRFLDALATRGTVRSAVESVAGLYEREPDAWHEMLDERRPHAEETLRAYVYEVTTKAERDCAKTRWWGKAPSAAR